MAHDVIDGRLVFRFVGDRSERVPERVESESLSPIDIQLAEQFAHLLANRVRAGVLAPTETILGDEHQAGVFLTLGSRPLGQCLPDRGLGLRPQRAAPANACLWSRVVD